MNGLKESMYRSSICYRIGEIVSNDFVHTVLITLHCSSTVTMPPDLAKRILRTWTYRVQRHIGGPFKYIRITDYGPHPIPEIVFYLVADLPADICRAECCEWYMGEASVSPLDEKGIDEIVRAVMRQSGVSGLPVWSYCGGKRKPRTPPRKTAACNP